MYKTSQQHVAVHDLLRALPDQLRVRLAERLHVPSKLELEHRSESAATGSAPRCVRELSWALDCAPRLVS